MTQLLDSGDRLVELVRKREETLERLSAEPREKPWLVAELDVSRSTVDRALSELTRVGFVCRVSGGYQTTTLGESLLESYRELRKSATTAADLQVIKTAPAALTPPADVLAAMEPAEPPPCEVEADEVNSLCVLAGSVDPAGMFQLCYDLGVEHGVSVTTITDHSSLTTLRDQYPANLRRLAAADGCRVFAGDVPDDELWIVRSGLDRRVVFTPSRGDDDSPTTLASIGDRRVSRWAEEVVTEYAIALREETTSLRRICRPGKDCHA